jgi:quaternary ammonium compound-resistance protein SugE
MSQDGSDDMRRYVDLSGTTYGFTKMSQWVVAEGEPVAWVVLVISGFLEAGWALSLKASNGLSKLWPSVAFVVLLIASMAGLTYALRTLPVGPAYAVWVGIGAVLTAIIGMIAFKDPVNLLTIGSIVLIIGGVVGLQLAGAGH